MHLILNTNFNNAFKITLFGMPGGAFFMCSLPLTLEPGYATVVNHLVGLVCMGLPADIMAGSLQKLFHTLGLILAVKAQLVQASLKLHIDPLDTFTWRFTACIVL